MKSFKKMASFCAIALAFVMLAQATTTYGAPTTAGISTSSLSQTEGETVAAETEAQPIEIKFASSINFEELSKEATAVPVTTAASLREEIRERSRMTKSELSKQNEADLSLLGTIGIVNVNLSLNVRVAPQSDAEVVGKLYQDSGVIIGNFAGDNNEWTHITSGAVRGWVLSQYLVMGELTASFYEALNPTVGTIVTNDVKVYKEASTDADILVEVGLDSHYPVIDYEGDFVKIQVSSNDIGYVHSEYVAVTEGLCVGVKVQDDYDIQDRIDELYEQRVAAREAAAEAERKEKEAAAKKKAQSNKNSSSSSTKSSSNSSTKSSSESKSSSSSSSSNSDSGTSEGWKYVGKFTITAYCTDCNTPRGSRSTYSGAEAKEWYTAAISMSGSPLSIGDTVKISGFGTFKIQDVGGSPYGSNWIDIFVNPGECDSTFKRNVEVWVKN